MNPYFETMLGKLYQGDVLNVLKRLPDESVDCIVTSPPYWNLRDYGVEGQFGLEPTLELYLEHMLQVTAELHRVLKKTGVCFWNHGSNYQDKCDTMQNWRLIIRMVDEQGFILRNSIAWFKINHLPSSVRDRFANAYEPVFMLVKQRKYWFDLDAIRVEHKDKGRIAKKIQTKYDWHPMNSASHYGGHFLGKNPGDVWCIPTQPLSDYHYAAYPLALVERCIKAGCPAEVCVECGKARERIVVSERRPNNPTASQFAKTNQDKTGKINRASFYKDYRKKKYAGWTDCGCGAKFEPGIVLDPFVGAGTTAIMAEKLGRRWIGIELNPEYCEIAKKRLKKCGKYLFSLVMEDTDETTRI